MMKRISKAAVFTVTVLLLSLLCVGALATSATGGTDVISITNTTIAGNSLFPSIGDTDIDIKGLNVYKNDVLCAMLVNMLDSPILITTGSSDTPGVVNLATLSSLSNVDGSRSSSSRWSNGLSQALRTSGETGTHTEISTQVMTGQVMDLNTLLDKSKETQIGNPRYVIDSMYEWAGAYVGETNALGAQSNTFSMNFYTDSGISNRVDFKQSGDGLALTSQTVNTGSAIISNNNPNVLLLDTNGDIQFVGTGGAKVLTTDLEGAPISSFLYGVVIDENGDFISEITSIAEIEVAIDPPASSDMGADGSIANTGDSSYGGTKINETSPIMRRDGSPLPSQIAMPKDYKAISEIMVSGYAKSRIIWYISLLDGEKEIYFGSYDDNIDIDKVQDDGYVNDFNLAQELTTVLYALPNADRAKPLTVHLYANMITEESGSASYPILGEARFTVLSESIVNADAPYLPTEVDDTGRLRVALQSVKPTGYWRVTINQPNTEPVSKIFGGYHTLDVVSAMMEIYFSITQEYESPWFNVTVEAMTTEGEPIEGIDPVVASMYAGWPNWIVCLDGTPLPIAITNGSTLSVRLYGENPPVAKWTWDLFRGMHGVGSISMTGKSATLNTGVDNVEFDFGVTWQDITAIAVYADDGTNRFYNDVKLSQSPVRSYAQNNTVPYLGLSEGEAVTPLPAVYYIPEPKSLDDQGTLGYADSDLPLESL